MTDPSHHDFSSYSHSVHSDVLLDPRAGAPPFKDDPDQQHVLLSLLSTKLLVEHGGARSTSLEEPKHTPSEAAAGKASDASKQTVLEQAYIQVIKKAHAEAVAAAAAGGTEGVVSHVLRKLAAVALEKLGGLRKAFGHFDADGDRRLSREDLGHTLEHHLNLILEPAELEGLFQALDYEKQGAVAYHEFVRILTAYAEDTEGGKREAPWSPPPISRTVKKEEVGVEGNETVGFDNTMAATAMTEETEEASLLPEDQEVLRQAQEVLTERGLHAHHLLKQLLPECEGKVDAAGLQAVFQKLGLPLSDAQAARLLVKADVMNTGKIVPWELVRLFSAVPTIMTE